MKPKWLNAIKSFVVTVVILAVAMFAVGQSHDAAVMKPSPKQPLRVETDTTGTTYDTLTVTTTDTSIIYPLQLKAPWPLLKLESTSNVGSSLRFVKNGTATGFLGISDTDALAIGGAESGDLSLRVENKNIRFSANAGTTTQVVLKNSGTLQANERVVIGQIQYPEIVKLHVSGSAIFGGEGSGTDGTRRLTIGAASGGYGAIGYNFLPSSTAGDTYSYLGADKASQLIFYEGGFRFRVAPAPTGWNGVDTPAPTIGFSDAITILPTGNVGIGMTPTAKLEVAGDIKASGTIYAKFQDVAEWVPATEEIAAGTVVVIAANNHVAPSTDAYDTRVAGVVSPKPGLVLGEPGDSKALVATTGRVKVRVDASNGPIREGDLLVSSSIKGTAMKSEPLVLNGRRFHQPGTVIGKALEPLDKGTGEILVLLSMQ